jgi:CBS domain-containing protein
MHRLKNLIERQKLVTGLPSATVFETVRIMTEGEVGAIPIIEDDVLVGVLSERDLLRRVVAAERDPKQTFISEVMTREVVTATLEDHVDTCLEKMKRAGCRHLPVETDGRVIAMIAMRDLLRDELEEQTDEIRFLRAYLHQNPLRG